MRGGDGTGEGSANDAGTGCSMMQVWEASMTHAWDRSSATLLHSAPARAEVVANDTLLGTNSIEADKIEPQQDDASGGPCLDLVVHSSDPSMLRCTTPSNAIPTLGFSGVIDLGVIELGLLDSLGSPSPPVNWG
jgi:hypothetical protein